MCLLSYVRNFFFIILITFGFIDITNSSLPDGFLCFQSGPCSCKGNNGEVVDLSPLVNAHNPLVSASTTELYIYHPCSDVPLQSKVINSCQKDYGICHFTSKTLTNKPIDLNDVLSNVTFGNFQKLATNLESVMRINQNNQLEIVYKHTEIDTTITTTVRLECHDNPDNYKLEIDRSTSTEHVLTLTSHYSCVNVPHHMSGGTIFFIILIVFVALYFIGGIIVLRFIRGATGIEMIPNYEFWSKVPQLAKDGVAYLSSCGKNTPDSYEKI